mgnify:CR=1 FL=1
MGAPEGENSLGSLDIGSWPDRRYWVVGIVPRHSGKVEHPQNRSPRATLKSSPMNDRQLRFGYSLDATAKPARIARRYGEHGAREQEEDFLGAA